MAKETIGSHIIHHCEQTGIVGRMGCVFSIIEDNHIHHINNMQQLRCIYFGWKRNRYECKGCELATVNPVVEVEAKEDMGFMMVDNQVVGNSNCGTICKGRSDTEENLVIRN